jgi:hypothetical protein
VLSAHPLRALFQGYKALGALTIDISTLFARYHDLQSLVLHAPDCSELPRVFPRAVPSLNHHRDCAQLLAILLQFWHRERSIKQKIAPAHHIRYFDIGSDLFGTQTSMRLVCFGAHVLPVYIRIPSLLPHSHFASAKHTHDTSHKIVSRLETGARVRGTQKQLDFTATSCGLDV